MRKLLRVLIVVLLIAGIVAFWLNLDKFGIEPSARFYVVGLGASAFALGLLYKLLGAWDAIPDWIPFLGEADDAIAWFLLFGGLIAGLVGWFLL